MELLQSVVWMAAVAGYGDPPDGYPSWAERELHLYTNAARVDPEAFEASYNAGGCSFYTDFSPSEQTPVDPLHYSEPLNDAARSHSEDMHEVGVLSHTSSDGTSFQARLAAFYPESGSIGENIAWNYPSAWSAVFEGWMCSTSGHRANIMEAGWNELGVGLSGPYFTQDFGGGVADSASPIRMGLHTPYGVADGGPVTFYADYADGTPDRLVVVLDGAPQPLSLKWGEADRGVYALETAAPESGGCHSYHFEWSEGEAAGSFPEEGSFQFGPECDADWIPGQSGGGGDAWWDWRPEPGADDDDGDGGDGEGGVGVSVSGCASAPLGVGVWGLAALLGLTRRRGPPERRPSASDRGALEAEA